MRDIDFVDDMDDNPQRVKKSGGFFGKLLAVFLGLIIGIIAGAGGVIGAGYALITTTNVKTVISTINDMAGKNIDISEYLTDTYANKTVLALVDDVTTAIKKVSSGEGTLSTLNEISPYVGNLVAGEDGQSGLVKTLNDYFIPVTAEDLMNKSLVKPQNATNDPNKYLTDYLLSSLNNVPVADFLIKLGYPLNDILLSICCGSKYTDWELNADGSIQMLNGKTQLTLGQFLSEDLQTSIYSLPLDSVFPIPVSDQLMMMLAYGDAFCYTVSTKNGETVVTMNQVFYTYDTLSGTLFDGRGTEIDVSTISNVDLSQGTCQLQIDKDTTYYLKAENVNDQRITMYAYSANDYTTASKVYYPKTTLNDFTQGMSLMDNMYLKDILNITAKSKPILISLAYGVKDEDYTIEYVNGVETIISIHPPRTVKDLREQGEALIYDVYLSDVISADASQKVTMYVLYGKENIHYSVSNGTITSLQKQVAVIDNKVYNEYGDALIGTLTNNKSFVQNNVTYYLGSSTGNTLTTKDNTVATLFYVTDEKGVAVDFEPTTLGDLTGNSLLLTNITNRLTLSDILTGKQLDGITVLSKLKDTYIANIAEEMSNLTVGEIYGDNNLLLSALKDTKLEALGNSVVDLTIGKIFGDKDAETGEYITDANGNIIVSSSPILNALSSTTLVNLEERAQTLTIGEIIPNAADNPILKHLLTSNLSNLASNVALLKFTDVFYDELWELYDPTKASDSYQLGTGANAGYATDGNNNRLMKPIWKYMFYSDVTTVTPSTAIPDYYIVAQNGQKGIEDMMKNMTANMQNTPLSYLIEDGLITFSDNDQKQRFLSSYVVDTSLTKLYLKDMSIIDVLNYIANIAQKN